MPHQYAIKTSLVFASLLSVACGCVQPGKSRPLAIEAGLGSNVGEIAPQVPTPQATMAVEPQPPIEVVQFTTESDFAPALVETTVSPLVELRTDSSQSTPSDAPASLQLNLPTALSMVDGQHPAIGLARWQVQEAHARVAAARVLWLPTIQAGLGFHRHDGNYQASDGKIVDVNRNSFQFGLGNGATGAGTTPSPGIVAQFHLADAVFEPRIAQRNAWARQHAEKSTVNRQLLEVSLAYTELLAARQQQQVFEESKLRTDDVAKLTIDFAEAGEGLQADADRLRTEQVLLEDRALVAAQRTAIASASLAQSLSLPAGSTGTTLIEPMDVSVLPLFMADPAMDEAALIQAGLMSRPELKEWQALVAAACEAHQQQRYAPLVPSVLLGFSNTGFGGGLGDDLDRVDGRYDLDAQIAWRIRNLGFGEDAARRTTSARVQQAKFKKLQQMDQIAREVSEAAARVRFGAQRIEITQQAIASAQESYQRNVDRIRDGEGLPLEVLQSVAALEAASIAYMNAVVEHNQAQFQLQWALGWPVQNLPMAEFVTPLDSQSF